MFSLLKKKSQELPTIDFSNIAVDFHAHWLPAVDDGCQTIEESITILTELKHRGYKKVYVSPHIMGERYTNTKHELKARFEDFKNSQLVVDLNLELGLTAEYLLDEKFENQIKSNNFLTLGNDHLLIETSMNYDFPFVNDYIFELQKLGYKLILAHPERYRYIYQEKNSIDLYLRLIDMGVELQLNLFSLVGLFGAESQKMAERLIEHGAYTYVSSDIHHPQQIKYFIELQNSVFLNTLILSNKLSNQLFL
jgi:protein-tyrosine phosphatase